MKNSLKSQDRRNLRTGLIAVAIFLAGSFGMYSCTKVSAPSLYDPNWKSLPQPVVDSLSPSGSALAGVDTVVIYGKNFSADRDSDGVYFNSTLINGSSIISASQTRLLVKAPAISGDTIQIRVYVIGAINFSSTVIYKLQAAISPFSKLATGEGAYGITTGADSYLYASLSNSTLSGTKDEGIFKIGSDGTKNQYALSLTGNVNWLSLKFGPGGYLYATKSVRAIYRFAPGGGTAPQVWASVTGATFTDMDFDQDHNLWVGGNNQYIYRVASTDLLLASVTNVARYPFSGNVRALRYYNGYLYFAANVGTSASKVYRAPIVSDTLGTPEVYFDLSNDPTGGSNIYAITFSADGNMYAGTDSSDYLIVVHPGGSVEKPYSLYIASKVLNSPCKSFAWIGTDLYATTSSGGLLKILARKQGAPYYGIQ